MNPRRVVFRSISTHARLISGGAVWRVEIAVQKGGHFRYRVRRHTRLTSRSEFRLSCTSYGASYIVYVFGFGLACNVLQPDAAAMATHMAHHIILSSYAAGLQGCWFCCQGLQQSSREINPYLTCVGAPGRGNIIYCISM